jgi:predicted glycosyltransferase
MKSFNKEIYEEIKILKSKDPKIGDFLSDLLDAEQNPSNHWKREYQEKIKKYAALFINHKSEL